VVLGNRQTAASFCDGLIHPVSAAPPLSRVSSTGCEHLWLFSLSREQVSASVSLFGWFLAEEENAVCVRGK